MARLFLQSHIRMEPSFDDVVIRLGFDSDTEQWFSPDSWPFKSIIFLDVSKSWIWACPSRPAVQIFSIPTKRTLTIYLKKNNNFYRTMKLLQCVNHNVILDLYNLSVRNRRQVHFLLAPWKTINDTRYHLFTVYRRIY